MKGKLGTSTTTFTPKSHSWICKKWGWCAKCHQSISSGDRMKRWNGVHAHVICPKKEK